MVTSGKECLVCKLNLAETQETSRIRSHSEKHYVRMYCPCGWGSESRDSVAAHQRSNWQKRSTWWALRAIHEVDVHITYPQFVQAMGLPSTKPFQECIPFLSPIGEPQPDRHHQQEKRKRKTRREKQLPCWSRSPLP